MKLSKPRVAGIVGGSLVVLCVLVGAAVLAWNVFIHRVAQQFCEEQVPGGCSDPGYVDETTTDDPELIAIGNRLLADVATPPQAERDPYGTACWSVGAPLCMSSNNLDAPHLREAVIQELKASGAEEEHRFCPVEDDCEVYLQYRGAPLVLTEEESFKAAEQAPATVTAWVMTPEKPDDELDPAKPLGPWASLGAAPRGWAHPSCTAREADGCRHYRGTYDGPGSAKAAVAKLSQALRDGGYFVLTAACPTPGMAVEQVCTVEAHRFRTVGALDGIVVKIEVRASRTGFRATTDVMAYP
jgi:hypothetical protein